MTNLQQRRLGNGAVLSDPRDASGWPKLKTEIRHLLQLLLVLLLLRTSARFGIALDQMQSLTDDGDKSESRHWLSRLVEFILGKAGWGNSPGEAKKF